MICGPLRKGWDRTDRDIITTKLFLVNIWFGAGKGPKKRTTVLRAHTIALKNVAKAAVKRPNFNFGTSFNCVRCQFGKPFIMNKSDVVQVGKITNVLWLRF